MVKLTYWQRACPKSFMRQLMVVPAEDYKEITPEIREAIKEYSQQHQEYFILHSQFWATNNVRFTTEQEAFMRNRNIKNKDSEEMAQFYQEYMIKYRTEFTIYNKVARRMAYQMLWTEIKWNSFRMRLFLNRIFGIDKKQQSDLAVDNVHV